MPEATVFNKYPPFPADAPVVDLVCVSLSKLFAADGSESKQLFQACQNTGFFLLDLTNAPQGEALLQHVEKLFNLNERTP